jgi:hypothetical protein
MTAPGTRAWPPPASFAPPSGAVRLSRREGRTATSIGRDAVTAGFPTAAALALVFGERGFSIEARPEAA